MALGIQDYYQMKAELELLKTLAESEEDAVNGRISPVQETFASLREELLERIDISHHEAQTLSR